MESTADNGNIFDHTFVDLPVKINVGFANSFILLHWLFSTDMIFYPSLPFYMRTSGIDLIKFFSP